MELVPLVSLVKNEDRLVNSIKKSNDCQGVVFVSLDVGLAVKGPALLCELDGHPIVNDAIVSLNDSFWSSEELFWNLILYTTLEEVSLTTTSEGELVDVWW